MRISLKKTSLIVFSALFSVLIVGSFLQIKKVEAQSNLDCEVRNAVWDPKTIDYTEPAPAGTGLKEGPRKDIVASADLYNCKDKWVRIDVEQKFLLSGDPIVASTIKKIDREVVKYLQTFTTGDDQCDVDIPIHHLSPFAGGCDYAVTFSVYPTQTDAQNDDNEIDSSSSSELEYNAVGTRDTPWIVGNTATSEADNRDGDVCSLLINSIKEVSSDGSTSPIIGQLPSDFYKDDEQPVVRVEGVLSACSGERVVFGPGNFPIGASSVGKKFIPGTIKTFIPRENFWTVSIDVLLGDQGCTGSVCNIGFTTKEALTEKRHTYTKNQTGAYVDEYMDHYRHIGYSCNGACDTPWRIISMNIRDEYGKPIDFLDNPFVKGYLDSVRNSPCYIAPQNPGDPSDLGKLKPDCYELLAPLPGLEAIGVVATNSNDEKINDGLYVTGFSLGFWVNRIVMVTIGFIGLIAVVMIIIAGVQYMTTEAAGGKSNAKEKITNALIGLVIALGIFVLLSTINPNLLDIDPDIESVTLEVDPPENLQPYVDSDGNTRYDYSQCANGTPSTLKDPLVDGCPITGDPSTTTCVPFTDGDLPNTLPGAAYKNIHKDYLPKLMSLKAAIISYNSTPGIAVTMDAKITEAFIPTNTSHCSSCHYNGTCTDIAFRFNGKTIKNASPPVPLADLATLIKEFSKMARASGLRAVYEAQGQRCADIKAAINDASVAVACPGHITGEHFSVYMR